MMRTGSSFVRARVLLFTVVVLCGLILTGTIAHARPAEGLKGWESGAWQKHAPYLISHQPCAKSTNNGGNLWPQHVCDSALADLAVRSGATMPRALLSHVFNYSGAGFDFGSDALSAKASFDIPKAHRDSRPTPIANGDRIAVNLPTKHEPFISLRPNAIPGSLLVTILALFGTVAVARRDLISQDHCCRDARSGLEVARITSPRHNSEVVIGHIQ
jgi:hypothetical protein